MQAARQRAARGVVAAEKTKKETRPLKMDIHECLQFGACASLARGSELPRRAERAPHHHLRSSAEWDVGAVRGCLVPIGGVRLPRCPFARPPLHGVRWRRRLGALFDTDFDLLRRMEWRTHATRTDYMFCANHALIVGMIDVSCEDGVCVSSCSARAPLRVETTHLGTGDILMLRYPCDSYAHALIAHREGTRFTALVFWVRVHTPHAAARVFEDALADEVDIDEYVYP